MKGSGLGFSLSKDHRSVVSHGSRTTLQCKHSLLPLCANPCDTVREQVISSLPKAEKLITGERESPRWPSIKDRQLKSVNNWSNRHFGNPTPKCCVVLNHFVSPTEAQVQIRRKPGNALQTSPIQPQRQKGRRTTPMAWSGMNTGLEQ